MVTRIAFFVSLLLSSVFSNMERSRLDTAIVFTSETADYDGSSCFLDATAACSAIENITDPPTADCDCACPSNKICVRKCCPSNQVLVSGIGCVHSNVTRQLFWNYIAHGDEFKEWTNLSSFEELHVIYGRPCKSAYYLDPREGSNDTYFLVGNGSLINQNMSEYRYCIDYVENKSFILPRLCYDDDDDADDLSLDASATNRTEKSFIQKLDRYLKMYGLSFSILCLILTFLVYAIMPFLQNLQGKNLLCHVLSLIVGYAGLLVISGILQLPHNICVISAFVVQFSFLASFFWLNIMCFDLWCTFSGYRSFNGSPKERDFKKFLAYCLYAWGCPTLIVAVTIFIEFYPYLPANFIKPQFGTSRCFFETNEAIFIYFYSFISVIVFGNLCMFISTTFILKKHKKEAKVFKRNGSRRHLDHDKQRFNLYLKLFIVMGVNWIMEVVSFYVPAPQSIWLITDICNTLQGVLIFLIFVCKRRIFILLNEKIFPRHPFVDRPKKNASTITSVISLASVRGAVVSPKSRAESTNKLDIEMH